MLDYKFITHIKNYLFKYIYRFKVNKFCKKLKKQHHQTCQSNINLIHLRKLKLIFFQELALRQNLE